MTNAGGFFPHLSQFYVLIQILWNHSLTISQL